MREVKHKIYKIDELSKEARNRAIQNEREAISELNDWWEGFIENRKASLIEQGYSDPEIYFNLSYAQGDGACFTAEVEAKKLIELAEINDLPTVKGILEKDPDEIEASIYKTTHMYQHENTINVEILYYPTEEYSEPATIEHELEELEEALREEARTISKDIYRDLQKEHEEVTSEENIIQSFKDFNEEFYQDGRRFFS